MGQAQAQLRHEGKTDGLEAAGNEVPVLEKEQQSQIEDDRRGHRPPGPRSLPLRLYFSTSIPWV